MEKSRGRPVWGTWSDDWEAVREGERGWWPIWSWRPKRPQQDHAPSKQPRRAAGSATKVSAAWSSPTEPGSGAGTVEVSEEAEDANPHA